MYDNIVAIDWAKSNMAIARVKLGEKKIRIIERESDIEFLKEYLGGMKGKKQVVFELSSSARKLYYELYKYADDIIVCDPIRNEKMKEGAKTDRIDAIKLAEAAKINNLNKIYIDISENFKIRRLISGYEDAIKAIVRSKNQKKDIESNMIESNYDRIVLKIKEEEIGNIRKEIKAYENIFKEVRKKNKDVRLQETIPGIGMINAIKIVGTVVEGKRFKRAKDYWGYCGLARHKMISGGRFYGTRSTRYNRRMKSIYKTAAIVAIETAEEFKEMYEILTKKAYMAEYKARNAIARYIAKISLSMLKNKSRYNKELVKEKNAELKGKYGGK